jgi:TRAP-type C4-dicarboxylate transport system permease small subunit
MNKLTHWLDKLLSLAVTLLMLAIVVTVSWQVISRYVFHVPSSGSEELARFLLIWIGMLGGVYAYRTKAHLGLNILTMKLSAEKQLYALIFSHLAVLAFSISVLVIGGINIVNLTLDPVQTSAALNINIAVVYSIIPISGLLFCSYAIVELLSTISTLRGNK